MRKKALDIALQPQEQIHVLFNPQCSLGGLQEANAVILAAIFKRPWLSLDASFFHALQRGPGTCVAALKIPVGMPVNAVGAYNKSMRSGVFEMAASLKTVNTL